MDELVKKIEEIYKTVIENKGCVAVEVDSPNTTEYDNVCSSLGYSGQPKLIKVPNEKWLEVIYMMTAPELYFDELKEKLKNDSNFRKQFYNNTREERIKWIIKNNKLVINKAIAMLTPKPKVNSTTTSKSCSNVTYNVNVQPEPSYVNVTGAGGKHPLKSKTIWLGIATIISSILMKYFNVNVSPQEVMQVIGFLIIIFRLLTHEKISL